MISPLSVLLFIIIVVTSKVLPLVLLRASAQGARGVGVHVDIRSVAQIRGLKGRSQDSLTNSSLGDGARIKRLGEKTLLRKQKKNMFSPQSQTKPFVTLVQTGFHFTLGVLGESQSLRFLKAVYGMGVRGCVVLRWRVTLEVRHPEPGLSNTSSLLLPSSPELQNSSCWANPSNTMAIFRAC